MACTTVLIITLHEVTSTHQIMQRIFCYKSYVTFNKLQCIRFCKLLKNVCSMSMEAAKKAAGCAAIDRHVKVSVYKCTTIRFVCSCYRHANQAQPYHILSLTLPQNIHNIPIQIAWTQDCSIVCLLKVIHRDKVIGICY